MTLLAPLALALSALAIPVVAMYILKLRRRQHEISSTLLWQRALDDVQANAPWQRLRPSVLLVLQLLVLLALVLALAGPAYTRSQRFSGDLILIVDESYGMQAHDVAPSRFVSAIAQAHALAADLPGGNVASVIGMGSQPRLAIAESSDGGAISGAIDSLRPGVTAPNFLAALSLAASLARSGERTRAVVLTSRESGISTLPLHVPFEVDIVRIGKNLHDLGITAFSTSRGSGGVNALARVGNFGSSPDASDLYLYVDGQLADVRPISLAPGKVQSLFWTGLPNGTRALHAVLIHHDDVANDKSAWAVTGMTNRKRVLLVTPGDYFLQTALALDPGVQLSMMAPASYAGARAGSYDLVVFDGWLPPSPPPAPALLMSPPAGRFGDVTFGSFRAAATVASVPAAYGGSVAPLLQYVDLSDVHLARVRAVRLPSWMTPIATSNGFTALAAGEHNGTRLAAATFVLQESDWPLRISFPILIQNLLRYLTPGLGLGATQVAAGSAVALLPPPGTRRIEVSLPEGGTDTLRPPFAPFTDTSVTGLYTARVVGMHPGSAEFAVNFFPARPAPAIGPARAVLGRSSSGSARSVGVPVNFGWVLALAVLALLSAEWWIAFRR